MRRTPLLLAELLLLLNLTLVAHLAAQPYTLTDLGEWMIPIAINDHGEIAGFVFGPSEVPHEVFYWSNGTPTFFGAVTQGDENFPEAIGNDGVTVGEGRYAWRWSPQAGMVPLPVYDQTVASTARGRNGVGITVGSGQFTGAGGLIALQWVGDIVTRLAGIGGVYTEALGMNEAGVLVGYGTLPDGSTHALQWSSTGIVTDLGTLPNGTYAVATAVNRRGVVIGEASLPDGTGPYAMWWRRGRIAPLPVLPGFDYAGVSGLNDVGIMVGFQVGPGAAPPEQIRHAVLWGPLGHVHDVNDMFMFPGWIFSQAYGINNRGEIVGVGTYQGVSHGWLLTPAAEVAVR